MTKFTSNLLVRLTNELNGIAGKAANELQKAEQSLQCAQRYIQELKQFIVAYSFKDETEEVSFFKEIKPMFLKELIFHKEVYHIEANKPFGHADALIHYYQQMVSIVSLYFSRNQSLYNYYQAEKTSEDRIFYLREYTRILTMDAMDIDSRFCTVHSNKLSKLLAFEMLSHHLHKSIYRLEHPFMQTEEGIARKFTNLWTGSQVDLIELGYGLYASGAVNNGRGDIKPIMTDLELIFNIDLGNYYRTFQNMRLRKKSLTPFLDNIKDNLVKKMEDY